MIGRALKKWAATSSVRTYCSKPLPNGGGIEKEATFWGVMHRICMANRRRRDTGDSTYGDLAVLISFFGGIPAFVGSHYPEMQRLNQQIEALDRAQAERQALFKKQYPRK